MRVFSSDSTASAKAIKLGLSKPTKSLHNCANSQFPFICDYVERTLKASPALGKTVEDRANAIYRGGLTIRTTIDPKVQLKSEKTITNYLDPRDPVDAVIAMIEPGTGKIVSMAQNRTKMGTKKSETYYNYAANSKLGGGAGYRGGSTFKMFVAAAALQNGLGAYGNIRVQRSMNFQGWRFDACSGSYIQPSRWNVVGEANRYFAAQAPWALRKTDPARMETVLWTTAETVRRVAILCQPFVPASAARLLDLLAVQQEARDFVHLGDEHALVSGDVLPAPEPVFPRYVEKAEGASHPHRPLRCLTPEIPVSLDALGDGNSILVDAGS